jgi:hypothetical protein
MANLEMLLGEMTQETLMGRAPRHGANHAAWNLRQTEVDRAPSPAARPLKKRGGCKTCDGTACVGRCRF